jgi:tetraacyldisaccharide 4'-kinase
MINKIWYQKNNIHYFLWPFSLLYRLVIAIRQYGYKINLFKSVKMTVPVIIVGNITVGGTGKTPLVIALVKALQNEGFSPGVITRGYGGKNKAWPVLVNAKSDPNLCGDEAVLIAKNTNVPVVAGPDRIKDTELLLQSNCNIIVSDDGLQHYALARDIEIAIVDSTRRFGNGFCLPAGPLRESVDRLNTVDFIVANGVANTGEYAMQFVIDEIVTLNDEHKKLDPLLSGDKKMMAIAGIGNPERFFNALRSLRLFFTTKIFSDHHAYKKSDFDFLNVDIILMTEKDAIKCTAFADDRFYVVKGHAQLDPVFLQKVIAMIQKSLF